MAWWWSSDWNLSQVSWIIKQSYEVICKGVGDLATVGGSVLVVTSFRPLPDSFSLCLRDLGTSKFLFFTVATRLRCGRVEFLRGRDVRAGQQEWDARYLDAYSAGAQVHCRFTDFSSWFTVCFNFGTLDWPPPPPPPLGIEWYLVFW